MSNQGYMHGARVKQDILNAGVVLWREGAEKVTARAIGNRLKMTHSGVLYHFKSAANLKDEIARHAVATGDVVVVPKLIVANHSAVAGLSQEDRQRYLAGC